MNNIIDILIKEAKKAYKKNEVPIGALIVKNNKIISKAYNKKNLEKNALYHAEILAIEKACKKLKTWHLEECEIYITMKPCMMCLGAIKEARISKIYYILDNDKTKYDINTQIEMIKYRKNDILDMLKEFFKKKR